MNRNLEGLYHNIMLSFGYFDVIHHIHNARRITHQ